MTVLRKAPNGVPLVWADGDSVFKRMLEPRPELGMAMLALARGVARFTAPLLGIVGVEAPKERGLPVKGVPKGIVVRCTPLEPDRCMRLPLRKRDLWAVTKSPLQPGVTIEMKHCGDDLEMIVKSGCAIGKELELASQTIKAVTALCVAGLWPTDIKLSNLAQMPGGHVVLLDYRGIWAPHTGVPAISSIVVQTLYHRAALHGIRPILGEFADQTLFDADGQFVNVPNVAVTVALATKLAVAELFGFRDEWMMFDRSIDQQITSLTGPPAKVCIANNASELVEFRLIVSPRTPFLER